MISMGFFSPDSNINLGMAFLESKEAADIFAEKEIKILMMADVFVSFPKVVEGELL